MKQFLYFIISTLFLLSFSEKSIIGTYKQSDENFFYQIELNDNHSFEYIMSFHRGTTKSKGKWKFNKDTLYLFDYEKPWTISHVEEKRNNTFDNYSIVEVIIKEDGIMNKANQIAPAFEIWINEDCDNPQLTNQNGIVKILSQKIKKISFDYDNYCIKDTTNNNYILTLSNLPIYTSPRTLVWSKWLLKKDYLTPIMCNNQVSSINLKK